MKFSSWLEEDGPFSWLALTTQHQHLVSALHLDWAWHLGRWKEAHFLSCWVLDHEEVKAKAE